MMVYCSRPSWRSLLYIQRSNATFSDFEIRARCKKRKIFHNWWIDTHILYIFSIIFRFLGPQRSARILVLARSRENWLTFFSLDLETFNLCFSFSSRNMRITICNLDLVSKHENNKMKISISSRQVRAINIILDFVSIFLHISHDILKSSYMMLHNIFSETVDRTPTKESES